MFDHPVYKLDQNSALLDKFLTEKIPKKKRLKSVTATLPQYTGCPMPNAYYNTNITLNKYTVKIQGETRPTAVLKQTDLPRLKTVPSVSLTVANLTVSG